MTELAPLEDLLAWANPHHSGWQLENAIVKREGGRHPYGMLRQALRELHSKVRVLRPAYIERDRLRHRVEHDRDLADYDLRLAELDLENMEHDISHMEREAISFWHQASVLMAVLGPLTRERIRELDHQWWVYIFTRECRLELATAGRLSKPMVEKLASMDPNDTAAILKGIRSPNGTSPIMAPMEAMTALLETANDTLDPMLEARMAVPDYGASLDLHRIVSEMRSLSVAGDHS